MSAIFTIKGMLAPVISSVTIFCFGHLSDQKRGGGGRTTEGNTQPPQQTIDGVEVLLLDNVPPNPGEVKVLEIDSNNVHCTTFATGKVTCYKPFAVLDISTSTANLVILAKIAAVHAFIDQAHRYPSSTEAAAIGRALARGLSFEQAAQASLTTSAGTGSGAKCSRLNPCSSDGRPL